MGMPVTFVRFAGCNLKCSFCDTKESWNTFSARDLSPEEIVGMIKEFSSKRVVITGGEPCIQPDIGQFIDCLHENGFTVDMETNASQPTPAADWIVASPKPDADYRINPKCMANELKFVVTDDFNPSRAIPEDVRQKYAGRIWLQPDGYNMEKMWQKAYDLAMADSRLRVGLQLHKIMDVK